MHFLCQQQRRNLNVEKIRNLRKSCEGQRLRAEGTCRN